jgi:DNA-binding MarR family transcriptional regulator
LSLRSSKAIGTRHSLECREWPAQRARIKKAISVPSPGIAQVDIAQRLQIDRATMMAITSSLARLGFSERGSSSAVRRRQTLHLTPTGAGALTQALAAIAEHEGWLKSRFNAREVEQLLVFLRRSHG